MTFGGQTTIIGGNLYATSATDPAISLSLRQLLGPDGSAVMDWSAGDFITFAAGITSQNQTNTLGDLVITGSIEGRNSEIRVKLGETVNVRITPDGDLTINGGLQIGNAAQEGTITPTKTLLVKDSEGTQYLIPVAAA